MIDARAVAPATQRNRDPILAVLKRVLPSSGTVLEIASGTGEHAVYFASALDKLTWLPSDPDPSRRASIEAWRQSDGCERLLSPIDLDASAPPWPSIVGASIRAVVCINMIHIAPWSACVGLFAGAGASLSNGDPLVLYGPFIRAGVETAPSNLEFDASLRSRDPSWGVRDLADVEKQATSSGFRLDEIVEMPANNLSVVFRKSV